VTIHFQRLFKNNYLLLANFFSAFRKCFELELGADCWPRYVIWLLSLFGQNGCYIFVLHFIEEWLKNLHIFNIYSYSECIPISSTSIKIDIILFKMKPFLFVEFVILIACLSILSRNANAYEFFPFKMKYFCTSNGEWLEDNNCHNCWCSRWRSKSLFFSAHYHCFVLFSFSYIHISVFRAITMR